MLIKCMAATILLLAISPSSVALAGEEQLQAHVTWDAETLPVWVFQSVPAQYLGTRVRMTGFLHAPFGGSFPAPRLAASDAVATLDPNSAASLSVPIVAMLEDGTGIKPECFGAWVTVTGVPRVSRTLRVLAIEDVEVVIKHPDSVFCFYDERYREPSDD
jgi:hypothetical protein